MAAPATHESKPGSAARDAGGGQARRARRVTGPLAGAVLGPTVCGGCERGEWHCTSSTAGLCQRDGGWFGLGSRLFAAEDWRIAVVGPDAAVLGSRETNKNDRFPGYRSMPASEKRDSRGLSARCFGADPRENGPGTDQGGTGVRWKARNGRLACNAQRLGASEAH